MRTIMPDIYAVGVSNPDLRVFDVIMETEYGTTYNAYLVKGQQVALVDICKHRFEEELLDNIREITDPAAIAYIIVNHTEPDHAGGVLAMLDAAPQAVVVGTRAALNNLKEIGNRTFNEMVATDGMELDLGGKTLRFITAPFLHWPDTMFTYAVEDHVLMSCDAFGAHYCGDVVSANLEAAQKYYFDVIMGPFKPYMIQALNKITGLPIDVIAPSHGPIHTHNIQALLDKQRSWCVGSTLHNAPKQVFIGYVSCYGYTRQMAETLGETLQTKGFAVVLRDLSVTPEGEVSALIGASDAVLVGSPTVNRDVLPPVWGMLAGLSAFRDKGKPAGAFGSFGWSGEAAGMILNRLQSLGLKTLDSVCRMKLAPNEAKLAEVRAYAEQLAALL